MNVLPQNNSSCQVVNPIKPTFDIEVSGYTSIQNGKYCFEPGSTSTITAKVTWGTYGAHSTPLYWTSTDWNNSNTWGTISNWGTIHRPYPYPQNVWAEGDADIQVTGMARDSSATSNTPNPNSVGMSNSDTVILSTCGYISPEKPTAVISLNQVDNTKTPPNNAVTTVNVAKQSNYPPHVKENVYTATVDSKFSYAENNNYIEGVRWKLPDNTDAPSTNPSSPYYYGKIPNVVKVLNKTTNKEEYFYPPNTPAPDTQGGKDFIWGQSPTGNNEWTYKLQVIQDGGLTSDWTTKTIKLTKVDNPPVMTCNSVTVKVNEPLNSASTPLNAKGSYDPEGNAVYIKWSLDNTNWIPSGDQWDNVNTNAPSTWKWSTAGNKTVYVKGTDGNHNNDVTKSCTVTVVEDSVPIYEEFYSIYQRVKWKNEGIYVEDQSRRDGTLDYSVIDPNSSIWRYSIDGGNDKSTTSWNGETKTATGMKTTLNTYNAQAAILVNHYIAPKQTKFTCSNTNKVTYNGKEYCSKSTTYWRMGEYTETVVAYGHSYTCTIGTTNSELKTINDYLQNWHFIPQEVIKDSNGKVIYSVRTEIENMLKPVCQ